MNDHLDKRAEEAERRRVALENRLDGVDDSSERNAHIADIATGDELGNFREGYDFRVERDIPSDVIQGMIVRGRREALHSVLNTADLLHNVENIQSRLRVLEKRIEWAGLFAFACLVGISVLIYKHW